LIIISLFLIEFLMQLYQGFNCFYKLHCLQNALRELGLCSAEIIEAFELWT
jgi:hypothetical protein